MTINTYDSQGLFVRDKPTVSSIGVYKTTVENRSNAKSIVKSIREQFPDCDVSFDLEDCDKVLRVESWNGFVNEAKIQTILQSRGFRMEKLP